MQQRSMKDEVTIVCVDLSDPSRGSDVSMVASEVIESFHGQELVKVS